MAQTGRLSNKVLSSNRVHIRYMSYKCIVCFHEYMHIFTCQIISVQLRPQRLIKAFAPDDHRKHFGNCCTTHAQQLHFPFLAEIPFKFKRIQPRTSGVLFPLPLPLGIISGSATLDQSSCLPRRVVLLLRTGARALGVGENCRRPLFAW